MITKLGKMELYDMSTTSVKKCVKIIGKYKVV